MTKEVLPQSPHYQWAPKLIEVRVCLSEKSLDKQSRFYSYVSEKGGYTIPTPCFFTTTSKDNNSFRVQINATKNSNSGIAEKSFSSNRKRTLSFHAISHMKDISIVCSKLNMSIALGCKIVARLEEKDLIFTVYAPNEAIEDSVVRNFEFFDTILVLRWKETASLWSGFYIEIE